MSISFCLSNQNHETYYQINEQCVMCLIDTICCIEQPLVKRKYFVDMFIKELNGEFVQQIINIFMLKTNIFLNFATVLIELLSDFKDLEHYQILLIKNIVQMIVLVKSEENTIYLIEFIIHSVLENKSTNIHSYLILFGQLLEKIPYMSKYIVEKYDQFLEYLLITIRDKNSYTKSIVCFIFVNILSNDSLLSSTVQLYLATICYNSLLISDIQLQINMLDLLQLLMKDESVIKHLFHLNVDDDFISLVQDNAAEIKGQRIVLVLKDLLMQSDAFVRLNTMKCLVGMLASSMALHYAEAILKADMAEILINSLNTVIDANIIKIYEVLQLLNKDSRFCSDHHILYGFDSILRNMDHLLKNRNYEILLNAFIFINDVFSKYSSNVKLFNCPNHYNFCIDLVKSTISLKQPRNLIFAATNSLIYLLTNDIIVAPVPTDAIMDAVNDVFDYNESLVAMTTQDLNPLLRQQNLEEKNKCLNEYEGIVSMIMKKLAEIIENFSTGCLLDEMSFTAPMINTAPSLPLNHIVFYTWFIKSLSQILLNKFKCTMEMSLLNNSVTITHYLFCLKTLYLYVAQEEMKEFNLALCSNGCIITFIYLKEIFSGEELFLKIIDEVLAHMLKFNVDVEYNILLDGLHYLAGSFSSIIINLLHSNDFNLLNINVNTADACLVVIYSNYHYNYKCIQDNELEYLLIKYASYFKNGIAFSASFLKIFTYLLVHLDSSYSTKIIKDEHLMRVLLISLESNSSISNWTDDNIAFLRWMLMSGSLEKESYILLKNCLTEDYYEELKELTVKYEFCRHLLVDLAFLDTYSKSNYIFHLLMDIINREFNLNSESDVLKNLFDLLRSQFFQLLKISNDAEDQANKLLEYFSKLLTELIIKLNYNILIFDLNILSKVCEKLLNLPDENVDLIISLFVYINVNLVVSIQYHDEKAAMLLSENSLFVKFLEKKINNKNTNEKLLLETILCISLILTYHLAKNNYTQLTVRLKIHVNSEHLQKLVIDCNKLPLQLFFWSNMLDFQGKENVFVILEPKDSNNTNCFIEESFIKVLFSRSQNAVIMENYAHQLTASLFFKRFIDSRHKLETPNQVKSLITSSWNKFMFDICLSKMINMPETFTIAHIYIFNEFIRFYPSYFYTQSTALAIVKYFLTLSSDSLKKASLKNLINLLISKECDSWLTKEIKTSIEENMKMPNQQTPKMTLITILTKELFLSIQVQNCLTF